MTALYLIVDLWTGQREWVEAPSFTTALRERENELRAVAPGGDPRHGKPPLPPTARASHHTNGALVDVSMADVACVGLRRNVVRESVR